MLYGATGRTGRLVLDQALERGHRPVLAGRNEASVRDLAELHALPWRAFSLRESERMIHRNLSSIDLLVNTAGPYTATAMPLVEGALSNGADYIDVCGELQVFEAIAALDARATEAGVCLLPGCGFEIVPSDALALWLAERMPDAEQLELGIASENSISVGTFRAATGVIAQGGFTRRNGKLQSESIGVAGPNIRFHQGERRTIRAPFPDLLTAWKLTGIPNITTYLALPPGASLARHAGPALQGLLRFRPLRRLVNAATSFMPGTGRESETERPGNGSFWGRVTDRSGETQEAWLRTGEAYRFTARAVVEAIERITSTDRTGFQTPAGLFGTRFAEKIAGHTITARLPI